MAAIQLLITNSWCSKELGDAATWSTKSREALFSEIHALNTVCAWRWGKGRRTVKSLLSTLWLDWWCMGQSPVRMAVQRCYSCFSSHSTNTSSGLTLVLIVRLRTGVPFVILLPWENRCYCVTSSHDSEVDSELLWRINVGNLWRPVTALHMRHLRYVPNCA